MGAPIPLARRLGLMAVFAGIPTAAAWGAGVLGWSIAGRTGGLAVGAVGLVVGAWVWWKFPEWMARHPGRVTTVFWVYVAAIAGVAVLTR